jgi:hypothetical protein
MKWQIAILKKIKKVNSFVDYSFAYAILGRG